VALGAAMSRLVAPRLTIPVLGGTPPSGSSSVPGSAPCLGDPGLGCRAQRLSSAPATAAAERAVVQRAWLRAGSPARAALSSPARSGASTPRSGAPSSAPSLVKPVLGASEPAEAPVAEPVLHVPWLPPEAPAHYGGSLSSSARSLAVLAAHKAQPPGVKPGFSDPVGGGCRGSSAGGLAGADDGKDSPGKVHVDLTQDVAVGEILPDQGKQKSSHVIRAVGHADVRLTAFIPAEPAHLPRRAAEDGGTKLAGETVIPADGELQSARRNVDVHMARGPAGAGAVTGSEWWHDSIILGRLSALALRYFASKVMRRAWEAWQAVVCSSHDKRTQHLRHRKHLALRSWRWRTVTSGQRFRRKLPLIRAVARLPQLTLRPAWDHFRQAVFVQRDLERRLRLLCLVERKMLDTLARTHYYHSLLRVGFAGFWLATQIPPHHGWCTTRVAMQAASAPAAPCGRIQQVVHRAWRRWWYATQMWLSSAEYRAREVEAWLAGECTTPRSILANATRQELGTSSASLADMAASPSSQATDMQGSLCKFPGLVLSSPFELAEPQACNNQRPMASSALQGRPGGPGLSRHRPLGQRTPLSEEPARTPRMLQPTMRKAPQAQGARAATPCQPRPAAGSQREQRQQHLATVWQNVPARGGHSATLPVTSSDLEGHSPETALADDPTSDRANATSAGRSNLGPPVAIQSSSEAQGALVEGGEDYWAMRCRIAPARAARPVALRQRC